MSIYVLPSKEHKINKYLIYKFYFAFHNWLHHIFNIHYILDKNINYKKLNFYKLTKLRFAAASICPC